MVSIFKLFREISLLLVSVLVKGMVPTNYWNDVLVHILQVGVHNKA